jgi:hypothetical protein
MRSVIERRPQTAEGCQAIGGVLTGRAPSGAITWELARWSVIAAAIGLTDRRPHQVGLIEGGEKFRRPCVGFCPVYNASITSNGQVMFDGIRHTATLGQKSVKLDAEAYRSFAANLASYRPAASTTAETSCETRISDQQHYRIVWTAPDGTKATLEHDRSCRSERNNALNAILQGAPEHLWIDEFAKQLTRPGASRG